MKQRKTFSPPGRRTCSIIGDGSHCLEICQREEETFSTPCRKRSTLSLMSICILHALIKKTLGGSLGFSVASQKHAGQMCKRWHFTTWEPLYLFSVKCANGGRDWRAMILCGSGLTWDLQQFLKVAAEHHLLIFTILNSFVNFRHKVCWAQFFQEAVLSYG